jgi:tetratricopeptide (TPR) repeat protein
MAIWCRLMRAFILLLVTAGVWFPACAHAPAGPLPAVRGPAVPQDDRRGELAQAEVLFRRGCHDCLVDALDSFVSLRGDAEVGSDASAQAVRTAVLLAVRENELGLVHRGYIQRARQLLGPPEQASPDLLALIEVGDLLATGPPGSSRAAASESQLNAMLRIARTQDDWAKVLRNLMPQDLAASYLWIGLVCGPYGSRLPDHDARTAALGEARQVPLIAYKDATACGVTSPETLEALAALEPRFHELQYHLGLFALGSQSQVAPDLDAADGRFLAAYEWRQDWPTLTLAIGNVAMSAEDFPRALDFYQRTLALLPDDPDALAGTIRALTYADRHTEAVAAADRMVATGRNPGEAYYWRALNYARLKDDEQAWRDVERASGALANADVPKLAGIVAINRRDFAVARERLELALVRRRGDCETAFYLQGVLAEQRDWEPAARVAAEAASCLEAEEQQLRQELDALNDVPMTAERRARQVARREQQLTSDARMRVTAWFNAAAANFNLARPEEARRYAEKVVSDPFFGERARLLLERLR